LTGGKIKGVKVDAVNLAAGDGPPPSDSASTLSALEASLIVGGVSQQTHDSITTQVEASGKKGKPDDKSRAPDVNNLAGLLLGSPDFQRR
jgi:hypothetical protein